MNNSKIYILCPAYTITGGIELLHQLCYKLCLLGYDAYIFYTNVEEGRSPRAKVYEKYNVRMVESIIDAPENVIVIPEIYASTAITQTSAKRVLWWMSVDNAIEEKEGDFEKAFNDTNLFHLSQSQYATDYLIENGVKPENIIWLCDYINSEYLHLKEVDDSERDCTILFNPRKGFDMTAKIIQASTGHVKWIALSNLYPETMREIMQHSRVYIDFGNHPGRDRIPREASMCGCLVITNKKGAAKNDVDILIDHKYKFDNDADPGYIFSIINDLVKNYSDNKKDYEEYRNRTANEFKSFEVDILNAFEKIVGIVETFGNAKELKEKILNAIYTNDINRAYRLIIKYRQSGYEEDAEFCILETTVRTEIGELFEAEYEAYQCLKENADNYEMLLILAKIHSRIIEKASLISCLKECQEAISLSTGTIDEKVVFEEAANLINEVKLKISRL